MKIMIVTAIMILASSTCFAQQPSYLDKWQWLVGEWKGEGDGEPGKGKGSFTFLPELDKKIILRKNHSEYPATKDKPKIIHDDLMIVYPDASGSSVAIYFDNEGHVINYKVLHADSTVVMQSDKQNSSPVFKLTYRLLKDKSINVKFEISRDGENFTTYTNGRCIKIK
ncbi:MAG TPA: hypothetical protein DGG95_10930 [Cytophagales bacterium]|jgi:hypothetical protein|nr:hypothetical protein [Cytophagales bacterium]